MFRKASYVLAAGAVAAVLWWWAAGGNQIPDPQIAALADAELWEPVPAGQIPPQDNYLPVWAEILGGDTAFDDATVAALAAPGASDAPEAELPALRAAGAAAATNRLTEPGRVAAYRDGDPYPDDEPDDMWAGRCTDVDVRAVAVMGLPTSELVGGRWAKSAVLYSGDCPDGNLPGALRVTYTYLTERDGGWTAVRPTQVPWSANIAAVGGNGTAGTADLAALDGCVADDADALLAPEAAATWEVLCDSARADGVTLEAVSAHRDANEQAERGASAAARFGDPGTAQRWVASVDSSGCASRHCAGAAVDISDPAGWAWLSEVTGCLRTATEITDVGDTGCGAAPEVTRGARYGWVAPLAAQPWHFEFTWPTTSIAAPVSCSPPPSMSAPEIVASVWRCRLGAAGLPAESVRTTAAEAVEVARCTTAWNPAAVEAGGRWVDTPDPATGKTRDGAGVFLLPADAAEQFAPGGAKYRADTRANAAGAAALWLAERVNGGTGWSRWPCAADVAPSAGAAKLNGDAYLW